MYLRENLSIAWQQLRSSKLRSILTTSGIAIGIATVIFIVSILEGYNRSITGELNMLGANVFQVQKNDRNAGIQIGHRRRDVRKDLKKEYSREIRRRCSTVKFVGAEVWNYNISFKYKDKKTNPTYILAGGEPEYFYNNAEPISRGRILSRRDVESNARVVVIGTDVAEELFPFEDPLGKYIKIAGTKFRVIGVFEKLPAKTFGQSPNNKSVIPITSFEDLYGSYRSVYLTVMVADGEDIQEAQDQVTGVLRKIRKVPPGKDNDFNIWTNDSLVDSFQKSAAQIQLVAVLIGAISLLVGSIGVMNIMLVTVTERTREIGLRKAIGAKRKTIMSQFLNESIFLSLIGGMLGMLLGFGLSMIISLSFDMPFAVPVWAVISALVVTSFVGLAAGMYPAAKASKLDPVEALRYE